MQTWTPAPRPPVGHIPPRASPPSPPSSPALTSSQQGSRSSSEECKGTNFPGSVRREQGRSGARSGLPPPLAGSPGGGRQTRAPGAAAVAAPAAGARPGSASWGGSEGRGTGGRAHASARERAVPRRARERPGLLLKWQCPRSCGAHWAGIGKPSCGRKRASRTPGFRRVTGALGSGKGKGGPCRGPRPRTRARRRRRRRAQGAEPLAMPRPGGGSPMAPPRARGAGRLLPRSSHFAPPPHPAYRSRIRSSAASGAVAKCGPRRHSRALCPCLALDSAVLAGLAAASGPGGRFRPGRLLRPGCSLRPRPPLPTQPDPLATQTVPLGMGTPPGSHVLSSGFQFYP